MATLTVRNLSDDILAELKKLAQRNGRSLEDMVRRLLAEVVVDHLSACELIEASWQRQSRTPSVAEVNAWLRESRP
ncbi:MAG: ribbon-helix-helix protein, CopG family [Deltaproteobacteria bacterium]|nr:ribbon-helix-helix protein, CopG family [Deltaproteobacteria bacterium]